MLAPAFDGHRVFACTDHLVTVSEKIHSNHVTAGRQGQTCKLDIVRQRQPAARVGALGQHRRGFHTEAEDKRRHGIVTVIAVAGGLLRRPADGALGRGARDRARRDAGQLGGQILAGDRVDIFHELGGRRTTP